MADGRSKPRKKYPPGWTRLFLAIDPENGSPGRFCELAGLAPAELQRLVTGKALPPGKLQKIEAICITYRVPLPFEEGQPALKLLQELHHNLALIEQINRLQTKD